MENGITLGDYSIQMYSTIYFCLDFKTIKVREMQIFVAPPTGKKYLHVKQSVLPDNIKNK